MKRLFDVGVSLIMLVILAIPMVLLACIVRFRLGSPIFFRQLRPGLKGKPFEMIKFRTMTDERDRDGFFLPDNLRLTPLGLFLRSTSLDELPEFWNVLKGEMSLVGPRPLLMEYLPLYSPEQARRHDVRPGLTGWAQVNGRNAVSWEERFRMDIWYVDHQSFLLDIKILCLTMLTVFRRAGVSEPGQVTMSRFSGSDIKK